nr:hypothetical protein [uncultured Oscillibacter sp.]
MKDSKRLLKTTILVLLLVLLGVELCMELRYPCKEAAVVSKDTEAILRRAPEVEITEEDRAMVEDLSQCAVVQSLLEGGENGDLSAADHPELMEAADRHLSPESAATVVVSAIFYEKNPSLYVNWTDGEGHTLVLGKERDGEGYYKLYRAGRKNIYENWDNERAQKSVIRRRWLGWLRDDLW